MKLNELINYIKKEYKIDYLDIKTLIKETFNVDNSYFIINENEDIEENKTSEILKKCKEIKNGKPLQYVTNTQYFYGLKFFVNKNVLIPQPDTEILVEETIERIKKIIEIKNGKKVKVLDLCTGSGAIAISIKNELKDKVEVYASDISKEALEVAKKNAKTILKEEINFIESDMFSSIKEKFDCIVSNPPYIKTEVIKTLDKEVQEEPILALDGGNDGLKFYKKIRKEIENYLEEDGILLMEIGYDQKEELLNLFDNAICIKDFANNDRVIIWKR